MNALLLVAIVVGGVVLGYAGTLLRWVLEQPVSDNDLRAIARDMQEHAEGYMRVTAKFLLPLAAVLALALWIVFDIGMGIAFFVGALSISGTAFVALSIAMRTHIRVAHAAAESTQAAGRVAYRAAAIASLTASGVAIILSALVFWLTDAAHVLGVAAGATFVAFSVRLGSVLYTHSTATEHPVTYQLGNTIELIFGGAAETLQNHLLAIMAAMSIGYYVYGAELAVAYPILVATSGAIGTLVAATLYRPEQKRFLTQTPERALFSGMAATAVALFAGTIFFMRDFSPYYLWIAGMCGAVAALILYAHARIRPLPLLLSAVALYGAYAAADVYGIALATTVLIGMGSISLIIAGYTATIQDARAMMGADTLGALLSQKNTAYATRYQSTALTLLGAVLFLHVVESVLRARSMLFELGNPHIIIGLYIGIALTWSFSAFLLQAVTKKGALARAVDIGRSHMHIVTPLLVGIIGLPCAVLLTFGLQQGILLLVGTVLGMMLAVIYNRLVLSLSPNQRNTDLITNAGHALITFVFVTLLLIVPIFFL